MLKDITFGQYYSANSVIHRADPRMKIVLLIALIVFIFLSKNMFALLFSFLFVLAVLLISKVPLKIYLKNLKAILPILIFTSIINMFYSDGSATVILSIWKLSITDTGIYRAVFMATRIILLIFISSVLTYTTTPNDLTDALEKLLSPLKYVGLGSGVHTLAMMMTIALRFIPTLVEEAEKIMNAQKARGADFENGSIKDRAKALIPILIPLLISSVRRAYELAEAMECRCYNGGDGKTRMKQLKLKLTDYLMALITTLFCVGIILINLI